MAEYAGTRVGPFEIIGPIGTGAFATVYKALDTRFDSHVALKIMADNHALNAELRERFITEAQTLRRIGSPATIGVYDIGETEDRRPYLVLELADRGNLVSRRAELLANGWEATPADVTCLIEALSAALTVVHAHDLVHRDIAPSNILIRSGCQAGLRSECSILRSDEQLVVADLGLVKDLAAGSGLTAGGGTLGFSSPEQRTPLAQVDARTDVYAATAVVRWLLSNAPVVEARASWATQLVEAGWPDSFVGVLERGLAADVNSRHSSIQDWRTDLRNALGDAADGPAADSGSRRIAGWQKAAAGALIALAIGVGGYAVGRNDSSSSVAAADAATTTAVSTTAVPTTVSTTAVPTTVVPTTVVPTTASPTTSTTDPLSLQEVQDDAPVPAVRAASVVPREDDAWMLVMAWGENPPEEVVGTEVQVAADDGPWHFEVDAVEPVANDWTRWSTGGLGDGDRTPVDLDTAYSVRARWKLSNGMVSQWSDVVAADQQ